ncbi:unnamed protein product [Didymodactylos carnosus]|uniref:G-protein coupled receptors family 1 profile domain-containing protein n=1 Tax=Didymodactylos carnosus TaxID=1234261 RepID=A0A815SCJ3_9BILA|nr:unnamed protein product [Didymodactylos carnosus]CAF4350347.1 unnamed protein product [Didymodactylos carnosus]
MDNLTNNANTLSTFDDESSLRRRIITILLLITFSIPSLICFLSIFYQFIQLRKVLLFDRINHHVILCILICDFLLISTELPFSLVYLSLGHVPTIKLCTFWIYWDYTLETTSLFLTMYASIERYLLVFHKERFIKRKILCHYIPLTIACLYIPTLYVYFIVRFPCTEYQQYNLTQFACGGACYAYAFIETTYDTIANTMIPSFLLLIFNLLMIMRVILLKRKMSPTSSLSSNTWKKNRRMILQLLSISLTCLIAWMPWVVIIFVQDFYDSSFGQNFITVVLHYLPYFTSFLSPFLALIGLKEIRQKLRVKRSTATPNSISATAETAKNQKILALNQLSRF